MVPIEKKAKEVFHELCTYWSNASSFQQDKPFPYYANIFHGFGASALEFWRGQSDIASFFKTIITQSPNQLTIKEKWVETRLVGVSTVALWGELIVNIKQEDQTKTIEPLRITQIYQEIEGSLQLIQSHASVPDTSQQYQMWPSAGNPKQYKEVTILFTDFIGFTQIAASSHAKELIEELNEIFSYFDAIVKGNGIEKLKTIGDAYMAVGGLFDEKTGQPVATVQAAQEMLAFLKRRNQQSQWQWDVRVGIHTGPVIGGAIGRDKLTFDLWGKTVNDARLLESKSAMNRINISAATHELIKDTFPCTFRGSIETKNKDKLDMYLVD